MTVIKRRRRRFKKNRPFLRKRLQNLLESGKLSKAEAKAARAALNDNDLLEAGYNVVDAEEPVTPDDVDDDGDDTPKKRDWEGFFRALADFVERLLKALLQLLNGLGIGSALPV